MTNLYDKQDNAWPLTFPSPTGSCNQALCDTDVLRRWVQHTTIKKTSKFYPVIVAGPVKIFKEMCYSWAINQFIG